MKVTQPDPKKIKLDQNRSEKVNLNCKICNKWFAYTAPTKRQLDEHYATIHKGEKIPEEEPKELYYNPYISKVYACVYCPKGKVLLIKVSIL